MRTGREGLRKGVFTLIGLHQFGKTGSIDCALLGHFFGERDRLAVMV